MKHKRQKMYFLHPGDLKRYRKEKDFTWKDIRKIGYYPEEIAEQTEEEKKLLKKEKKETKDMKEHEIETPDVLDDLLDMSEEELRKMIDKYLIECINEELSDDRLFEHVKELVNKRKPKRIVINLPAWLKERLKQKSTKKGISMNAVMRVALTEYLAKDE